METEDAAKTKHATFNYEPKCLNRNACLKYS